MQDLATYALNYISIAVQQISTDLAVWKSVHYLTWTSHSFIVSSAQDLTRLQPRCQLALCSQLRCRVLFSAHVFGSRAQFCSCETTDSLSIKARRIASLPLFSFYKKLSRLNRTHSESAPLIELKPLTSFIFTKFLHIYHITRHRGDVYHLHRAYIPEGGDLGPTLEFGLPNGPFIKWSKQLQ